MLQVLVVRMAKMVQTVQRDFQVHEVSLVSVVCLASKEMLDLVVSTVVMVVTERKVRLVLQVQPGQKATLVLVVRRVSRGKQVLPVLKVRMGRMVNKVRLVPLV